MRSSERPAATTWYPRLPICTAVANPIPEEGPVIITVLIDPDRTAAMTATSVPGP